MTRARTAEAAPSGANRTGILLTRPKFDALQSGSLLVRLAENDADRDAAQALRFRVFYEEMSAAASPVTAQTRRDRDAFDNYCDHLLVIDRAANCDTVVGTYRLMRRDHARQAGAYYSADEYNIACIVDYPGEVMELGRSCVDRQYRHGRAMQLLWRGIARYVFLHGVEIMFGCGSLPGTDAADLSEPLSYLYHYHLAPPELRPRAVSSRHVSMNLLAKDDIDVKSVTLPPLIKGYLRLGGFVGDGAVVDRQFNTTDVCIVVKTDRLTGKYFRHYARDLDVVGQARASLKV